MHISTEIEMDTTIKPSGTSKVSKSVDNEKITSATSESTTNTVAVIPLAHQNESSVGILTLHIDCFGELFEYLPLEDILCMGQTCKQLHENVLNILQQCYSGAEIILPTRNELRIGNVDKIDICIEFIEFAHRISVYCDLGFIYLNQIQSKFIRLRHLHMHLVDINQHRMNGLKGCLKELEVLQLSSCDIKGGVHEMILAFCPNIKRLGLIDSDTDEIDLFHHEYPRLEHFELVVSQHAKEVSLTDFLKLNPNIRSLSISTRYSMNIEQLLDSTGIHLAELAITNRVVNVEFVRILRELHKRKLYQRLKLHFTDSELIQDNIDHLATLDALVKLYLGRCACKHSIAISALSCLEELFLYECDRITDMETAASSLSRLGRIHFKYASIDDILPFIKRARRVKKVKVEHLLEGIHFSMRRNVIDLVALNEKREKLDHAHKLTIYVKEKVYLATKWALKDTDYSLIRLKREESYEWTHDFEGLVQ